MIANQAGQTAVPQTTLELVKYILKRLPGQILKALPITIAVGVISWLAHTYLLVVANEGFNPDTWLAKNFLNVKGGLFSSSLLWAMMGGIISMTVTNVLQKRNPFRSVGDMFKIPGNVARKNKEMSNSFFPVLLITSGVTFLIEQLLSGVAGLVAGGILLSSVAAFAGGYGGILAMTLRMIFTDIQHFILRKQKLRLDNEAIYLIFGASGLAFAAVGLLITLGIFGNFTRALMGLAGLGLLIWGIVLIVQKKNNSTIPKSFIFIAIFALSLGVSQRLIGSSVAADDGGWLEAGGTFIGWVSSEGAIIAVMRGLPPAIAGILGSFIASILSGLGPSIGGGIGAIGGSEPVVPVPTTGTGAGAGTGTGVGTGAGATTPADQTNTTTPTTPSDKQTDTQKAQDAAEKERLRFEQEKERARLEAERKERERQDAIRKAIEAKLAEERKRKQDMIDKLCAKYNTTPDKLRDVLTKNRDAAAADAAAWNRTEKILMIGEKLATATVVVADTAIDGLASIGGPGAKGIRAGYKIIKGAAASGAKDGWTTENLAGGAVSGGADALTDVINNPAGKAAVTIIGETASGAITGGADGAKDGFVNGVFSAGVNYGTDKLAGNGFGNEMSTKFHSNGTATVSVKTGSGWVDKTVSGTTAIKFHNNKLGAQATTSAIKGTIGMGNELVVKPTLQEKGILPD